MRKTLFTFCTLAIALLSVSCDNDKDAEDVVPAMDLTMARNFMYHDTHETVAANYKTEDLQTAFVTENEQLTIYLDSGTDGVSFEIEEEKLSSGYVGNYTLQTLPNPDAGDANATFIYKTSAGSGSAYFSKANFIYGIVKITTYDQKHQLISGTFQLKMDDVPDPTITLPTSNPRRCDVTVTGTFENAKLTINP